MSVVGKLAGWKPLKNLANKKGDAAAMIALVSTTTKDAVNCYYYTTQSYNNEKIPEDKRKFVAAMDLVNGVLNVGVQLLLGSIVESKGGKLYDRFAKKLSESKFLEEIKASDKSGKAFIRFTESGKFLADVINKHHDVCKSGFKVLSVLLVTQVFVKRVIVPFLATPLASLAKKRLDKMEAEKKGIKPTDDSVKEQAQAPAENKTPTVSSPVAQKVEHKAFSGFESIMNKK